MSKDKKDKKKAEKKEKKEKKDKKHKKHKSHHSSSHSSSHRSKHETSSSSSSSDSDSEKSFQNISKHKSSHERAKDHSSKSVPNPLIEQINEEDDYFKKNEEFRVWLKLFKKISFESLTSEKARSIFGEEFVPKYNEGVLPKMYYEGIPLDIREEYLHTKHKWNFKISKEDKEKLIDVTDKVDSMTRSNQSIAHEKEYLHPASETVKDSHSWMNPKEEIIQREIGRDAEIQAQKRQRKMERDRTAVYLEEIAPKDDSDFAKRADKRRNIGDALHGAAKDREINRDGDLSEDFLFGSGGNDDFESMKARLNKSNELKRQMKEERLRDIMNREKQKQTEFLEKLGINEQIAKGGIG